MEYQYITVYSHPKSAKDDNNMPQGRWTVENSKGALIHTALSVLCFGGLLAELRMSGVIYVKGEKQKAMPLLTLWKIKPVNRWWLNGR